jgi:hypothetical protein
MDEFTGRWEEVLDQAQEFRKFDINNRDGELQVKKSGFGWLRLFDVCFVWQEQEFLLYMEKRGEPMTPLQLRETLKDIDLDKSKGVSFIELMLWRYKKTVADLLTEIEHPLPAELAAKINADIAVYQGVQEAERARFQKISTLTALVEAGGAKGLAAKAELEQLRTEDTLARNKAKVEAEKRRRASQTLLESWEKESAAQHAARLAGEQGKVDADKAARQAAEDEKRLEGQKKIQAKAALWSQ